jgi:hypothetical protein
MKNILMTTITLLAVTAAWSQIPGAGETTLMCGGAVDKDGNIAIGAGYELTCQTIMAFPMGIHSCSLVSYPVTPNPQKTPHPLEIIRQAESLVLLQNLELDIKGSIKRDTYGSLKSAKFTLGDSLFLNCRYY